MAKITAGKTRFYHASQAHLPVGTELRRGRGVEGHNAVFFTTSPVPHYTMAPVILASKRPWYVYEIQASGYLGLGTCWDEGLATLATVIRCVGNARGILLNSSRRRPTSEHSDLNAGSISDREGRYLPLGSSVRRSEIQKARKRASR